jgi:hypothetical protein
MTWLRLIKLAAPMHVCISQDEIAVLRRQKEQATVEKESIAAKVERRVKDIQVGEGGVAIHHSEKATMNGWHLDAQPGDRKHTAL